MGRGVDGGGLRPSSRDSADFDSDFAFIAKTLISYLVSVRLAMQHVRLLLLVKQLK